MSGVRPGVLLAALSEALLPAPCPHCSRPLTGTDRGLCTPCMGRMVPDEEARCRDCGGTTGDIREERCIHCRQHASALTEIVCWGEHDGVLRTAILQLKHHGHDELAAPLGRRLASRIAAEPWSELVGLVTWVPSHPLRTVRRGRPAARQIAAHVAASLGRPAVPLLRRRGRVRQVGRTRSARQLLPARTFSAGRVPENSCLLVVDDVLTTGTTMTRAAAALRRAGAGEVYGAVMARTPDPRRST